MNLLILLCDDEERQLRVGEHPGQFGGDEGGDLGADADEMGVDVGGGYGLGPDRKKMEGWFREDGIRWLRFGRRGRVLSFGGGVRELSSRSGGRALSG